MSSTYLETARNHLRAKREVSEKGEQVREPISCNLVASPNTLNSHAQLPHELMIRQKVQLLAALPERDAAAWRTSIERCVHLAIDGVVSLTVVLEDIKVWRQLAKDLEWPPVPEEAQLLSAELQP